MTYVAVPVQVFSLTQSSKIVGTGSALQLIPLLALGLPGGSVADRFEQIRLRLGAELLMAIGTLTLDINSWLKHPSFALILLASFLMQAVNAFRRPIGRFSLRRL